VLANAPPGRRFHCLVNVATEMCGQLTPRKFRMTVWVGIGGDAAWTTEVSFVRGPAVGGQTAAWPGSIPQPAVPTGTETTRPGLIQEVGETTAHRRGAGKCIKAGALAVREGLHAVLDHGALPLTVLRGVVEEWVTARQGAQA
jgi:hypothetical protein